MKKILALVLVFLFIMMGSIVGLMPAKTVDAEDLSYTFDENFTISVSGEASQMVAPDTAKIMIAIENTDLDIENSKNINFENYQQVVTALKNMGIAQESIVLESFSSYPNYDYNNGKTLTGYFTSTLLSVQTDVANIKQIVDTAIENGATSICSINYQVSNMTEIYNQVLTQALNNAKSKAQMLTGKQDVKVLNIKEEIVYSSTSLYKTYSENLQDNAYIGQLCVKAKVCAEFC